MTRHAKDAVLIGKEVDGTQAWHDLRRSGVGGSDIAKILGVSPWGDSYSLWYEKTGDSVAAEQTSPLMEAGHYVAGSRPVVSGQEASRGPVSA